jgi:membrane protease YdiL (CAAX protease family)
MDVFTMNFLFEFFLVMFVGVFPLFMGSYFLVFYKRPNFTGKEEIVRYWIGATAMILTVLYVATNHVNGLSLIGLISDKSKNASAVDVGMVSFAIVMGIYILGIKILQKEKKLADQPLDITLPHIERIILYKNFWERLAYLIDLSEMVIAEELVFRGFLVLFCGTVTGSYVPWIIVSISFSVIVHLYQGKKTSYILFHAMAAAVFIGVTIFTRNILSAITAHLFYNIPWTIGIWSRTDKQISKPEKGWEINWTGKAFYAMFIVFNLGILFYGLMLLQR